MRTDQTASRPPPHPTAHQWARSPEGLPDVVLCTGAAEHYEGNIHDALKLVLVPDAPFEIRRRGTHHRAAPGQLIALHPDEAHSGEPRPANTNVAWLLMCLGPTTLADAGFPGPGGLTFPDPALGHREVGSRYRRLHRYLESPVPTLAKQAAIARFVAVLAPQAVADPDPGPGDGRAVGPSAARDFLGDQLDRNVTLGELATVAAMSPYQLTRAFTRRFGLPPHALHLRLRLDRAQDLLRRGRRATDVAHATGFADQAHFTRSFKRLYGITPARYQRNAKSPCAHG